MLPSLPHESALANAPCDDGQCYLVPAVFGEDSECIDQRHQADRPAFRGPGYLPR